MAIRKFSGCREPTEDKLITVVLADVKTGQANLTYEQRRIKKGIVPVFGAGAYNPKEKVTVNGQKITLAQYASRMNIKLLRPADFNVKLREHGVAKKVTVQKICRACRDEKGVRFALDEIWQNPSKAQKALVETLT